jgi:hypothetical protein
MKDIFKDYTKHSAYPVLINNVGDEVERSKLQKDNEFLIVWFAAETNDRIRQCEL